LTAEQLRFDFIDTDHLIESRAGKSITRIFAEEGEAAFRQLETQTVAELAAMSRVVCATGGGMGANPEHLARLKEHALVVCLWANTEIIWERVRRQTHRPLLQVPDPKGRIRELLAEREPVYRQADILMDTGYRQLREVAHQVVHQFRLACRPMA
jgi:shikimate kinase